MHKLTLTLAIACSMSLAVAACGNKKTEQDEGTQSAKPGPGAAAEKAGPPALSAPDFYRDYNSLQGMEVMDKYGDGVVVSGTVLRTIEEMDGSLVVWLDAGDGNWVSLGFVDKGEAAKQRGVAKDSQVEARCQVGGASGKYVMNIDCELL